MTAAQKLSLTFILELLGQGRQEGCVRVDLTCLESDDGSGKM